MNPIYYLLPILALFYSGVSGAYEYHITNNTESELKVKFEYKEFFGTCSKPDEFTLGPKMSSHEKVAGACCVRRISASPSSGSTETSIIPGAMGIGTKCFNFGITINPKPGAPGNIEIIVD